MKSQCAGPRADRELAVLKKVQGGDSLAVQGLRLHTSTAQGAGSTPGQGTEAFPGGSTVNNPPDNTGDMGSIPGRGRSPGKEMATHSSILAWEIPWTEEPGGLVHGVAKESDTT